MKPSRLETALFTEDKGKDATGDRLRVLRCIKLLNSEESTHREGALKDLMSIITDTTKTKKTDLRQFHRQGLASIVGDREVKKLIEGTTEQSVGRKETKAGVNPLKEKRDKAIAELQKLHPVDNRGPGTAYESAVKVIRADYSAGRKAEGKQ